MSRSMQVLSVLHQLQGPQFEGYVKDRSYELLVKRLIGEVDFVFEEAGGRQSSVAQDFANGALGAGQYYLDVDPTPDERQQYGIAEKRGEDFPVDPSQLCSGVTLDIGHCAFVSEHRKREELWLQKIQSQVFEKGLMVCGISHGLSFAFRLLSVGFSEVRLSQYLPHGKVCGHKIEGNCGHI